MAGTPKIIILSEQLRGQSFELTGAKYTIGRVEGCDICIPDGTVSSNHCTLLRTDDGVYSVRDEGSTNGTRLNGVRLKPQQTKVLSNSDILQVGGVEMFYDSEEHMTGAGPTTQTVINLEDSQTGIPVSEMTNFSPFGQRASTGESKRTMIVVGSIIGLLLAAVLVALVVLIMRLIS